MPFGNQVLLTPGTESVQLFHLLLVPLSLVDETLLSSHKPCQRGLGLLDFYFVAALALQRF
jgi:hypothetical protein